jgi:hypothetical protein
METSALMRVFRPFKAGGIADLSDREAGDFIPSQDVSVEKFGPSSVSERGRHGL